MLKQKCNYSHLRIKNTGEYYRQLYDIKIDTKIANWRHKYISEKKYYLQKWI